LPPPDEAPPGITFPAAEYDHRDGDAVTGGFVYRGKRVPELIGKYVFGDIVRGAIFYLDVDALQPGKDTPIYKLRLFYRGREADLRSGIVGNAARADLRFGLD